MITTSISPLTYQSARRPIWCAGCGDYNVLSALYSALAQVKAVPEETIIVSGIGCSGRLPGFVNSYGFHTVHGRALPIAVGAKVARPELTALAVGGDGDGMGIGGGHLPHVARRNPDLTYILVDNSLYGQTKGQTSATTPQGQVTSTAPYGNRDQPLNPVLLALAYGASFVARGFAGAQHHEQLTELMAQGIRHKGFGFIHVLSPCVTFNPVETYRYYQERVTNLPATHDPSDRLAALGQALAQGEKIPLGLFYQASRPTLEEGLEEIRRQATLEGKGSLQDLLDRFA